MSTREQGRALQAIDYNQDWAGVYFKLTALKSSGTKFSLSLPRVKAAPPANCPDDEMERERTTLPGV